MKIIRQRPDGQPPGSPPPHLAESFKAGHLGDLVACVAQPIARTVDHFLGTDLEHCGGCDKRRKKLNDMGEKIARSLGSDRED